MTASCVSSNPIPLIIAATARPRPSVIAIMVSTPLSMAAVTEPPSNVSSVPRRVATAPNIATTMPSVAIISIKAPTPAVMNGPSTPNKAKAAPIATNAKTAVPIAAANAQMLSMLISFGKKFKATTTATITAISDSKLGNTDEAKSFQLVLNLLKAKLTPISAPTATAIPPSTAAICSTRMSFGINKNPANTGINATT